MSYVTINLTKPDGSGTQATADANGALKTSAGAAESHIGEIGGNTAAIKLAPTISANAIYAAGDIIGGVIPITDATYTQTMRVAGGTAILESIQITDFDNEKAGFDLLIFDALPQATTVDNAAFAWGTSGVDLAKCIARINVASTDYVTFASKAVALKAALGIGLKAASTGTTLYLQIIATATPTYTLATDLGLVLTLLRD